MDGNGITTKADRSEWWIERAENFWGQSNKNLQAAKETLNYIDNAINIDPLSSRAWADKGFILKQMGEFDNALLCLDRALALNRDFISPWYNKAVLLGLMGRVHEALKCYDMVLQHDPEHQLALRDRDVLVQMLDQEDDI